MKRGKVIKDVKLIGCVTVSERDENNNVSGIVISTEREDYLVEPKGLGRDLLVMEGEEVVVKGKLTIENDGTKRILVNTYELYEMIEDTYYQENDFYYVNENYDPYDYDYDDDGDDLYS